MDDEKVLISKSETIGVVEIRKLMELAQTMNRALTMEEYIKIVSVYGSAIDRLIEENEEV